MPAGLRQLRIEADAARFFACDRSGAVTEMCLPAHPSSGCSYPFLDAVMIVSPSMKLQFQLRTFALLLALPAALLAQQQQTDVAKGGAKQSPRGRPQDTEVWEPVPPIVTPGRVNADPPSDAIVLFDGKNQDEWVLTRDKSPARWTVADGVLTVSKERGVGNIETKRAFHNYQLHIEWKIPENITGSDQARGNSGVP